MTSAAALYYPYIHFRDEAWVKQAALYWDNVARIVPGGYGERLHDGDVVKALRDEAGVVLDREPEHHVVETVSEELCRVIDAHADALAQHFSPDPFGGGDASRLAYIYHSKMDDVLVDKLLGTGLGTFRRSEGDADDEWLGVHQKIGQAYMTALASSLASRGELSVVSDDPRFAVAGCGFPVRQLFDNLIEDDSPLEAVVGERAESMLGVAAIERVLPQNLDGVTVEEIVEFRRESVLERARYRDAISAATDHLEEVRDAEALRQHLEASGAQIDAAVKELEGKMNRLLGDSAIGVIGVSKDVPELMAAALAGLGITMANPFVAAVGLSFNAFRAIREGRRENEILREQPYAYLVALREEFGMTGTLERLRTGARKLILG